LTTCGLRVTFEDLQGLLGSARLEQQQAALAAVGAVFGVERLGEIERFERLLPKVAPLPGAAQVQENAGEDRSRRFRAQRVRPQTDGRAEDRAEPPGQSPDFVQ